MEDRIFVHGIVLSSTPVGEADRRLVILTGERGKITAFARGSRRPKSPLIAASRPFTYGGMELYESKNYYVLESVEAVNYFEDVATDLESSCYAAYFAELADFYGREGLEAKESVRLLYAALLALRKKAVSSALIRAVYELRLLVINGEYTQLPEYHSEKKASEAVVQAWTYCISAPLEKLFSFDLKEKAKADFTEAVDHLRREMIPKNFKSLEILETLL